MSAWKQYSQYLNRHTFVAQIFMNIILQNWQFKQKIPLTYAHNKFKRLSLQSQKI